MKSFSTLIWKSIVLLVVIVVVNAAMSMLLPTSNDM